MEICRRRNSTQTTAIKTIDERNTTIKFAKRSNHMLQANGNGGSSEIVSGSSLKQCIRKSHISPVPWGIRIRQFSS